MSYLGVGKRKGRGEDGFGASKGERDSLMRVHTNAKKEMNTPKK